jgi:membrane associated rhomboid family serine protease
LLPIRDINPTRMAPVITLLLIGVNVAVFFFLQQPDDPVADAEFLYEHAVIACEVTTGEPLSLPEIEAGPCVEGGAPLFPAKNVYLAAFTSMFLHGGILHLLGNMWFLWIFGNNVEEAFGRVGYLVLYLAAGVAATAGFVVGNDQSTIPLVGASGAIAGVLGAYAVLFPKHQVLSLIFIVFVPVPSVIFLAVWFFTQFAVSDPTVAWEAHVVGFLFGMIVAAVLRRLLLGRLQRIHAPIEGFRV